MPSSIRRGRDYQDYWASPEADKDMKHVPPGMTDFFRAFYYMKSADFPGNQNLQPLHPVHTAKEAAEQNAQIPEYYVMRREEHAGHDRRRDAGCRLYQDLQVADRGGVRGLWAGIYAQRLDRRAEEYRGRRNNAFRRASPSSRPCGPHDRCPAQVIAGREDWGANRTVGGPMNIGKTGYTQFKGVHMVEGAGHWAHEEQPEKVSQLLTAFLREHA